MIDSDHRAAFDFALCIMHYELSIVPLMLHGPVLSICTLTNCPRRSIAASSKNTNLFVRVRPRHLPLC